ncbi:Dipeptide transport ATP-binding protein DppD [Methanosarcina barkeri str. Wiesmoor]|uniref:Nickel import system ATP-binding protein NikD n=2 Tax=Methanosarcina barkeri TaxID=2208 RepID=A0A0E3QP82_METBA|nr:ABC transporter ATP-binding protein [Methanosarcina barkeri]AKB51962.1 Dipeptide transport ATP-binding protein DppD [Methanosarcina barkeri str. Wiesmoor]
MSIPSFSTQFLSVENLSVSFKTSKGLVKANENISFEIKEGEIFGLIGETGCGKTTLGKALLRLLSNNARIEGRIVYRGKNILSLSEKEMRSLRGKEIGIMLQDPSVCFNPVLSIGSQIAEIYRYHEGMRKKDAKKKASEMLELVGIDSSRKSEYPHQFSGGMLQRVMIAVALALKPRLLIADEPTKGLDPDMKLQILEIITKLVRKENSSMLLITHDLDVATKLTDRTAVMYAGEIVEIGKTATVISDPKHPYTFALLHSLPEKGLMTVLGQSPSLISPPSGCRYHPRCSNQLADCSKIHPELLEHVDDHFVRCLLSEKNSKNVRRKDSKNVRREAQLIPDTPSPGCAEVGLWHC